MCVPLVFLVPLIWKGYRRTGRTVLLGAGFSLLIELSQMITARAADIDDLIANTSGAFLGYIAWKIFTLLFGVHLKQGGR